MNALFTGVVENRKDPLKLGRCQVRIVGLHTDDKTILPTEELPWAFPMQPIGSAAMNGIGWTPVGPVHGTWVVIMFHDEECQMPIMIGTVGGIPQSKASERIIDNSDSLVTDGGVLTDSLGKQVLDSSGAAVTLDQGVKNLFGNASSQVNSILGIDLTGGIGGVLNKLFDKAGEVQIQAVGASDDSKPTIQPQIVSKDNASLEAQPVVGQADSRVLESSIKLDPPPKYAVGNVSLMKQSISAIIAACDQLGYTSKYAKCSILGICGGESNWLPVEEGHSYSAESLLKVFPGVFKGDLIFAKRFERMSSKADFFREIYHPKYSTGKRLGNKQDNDGALFYGRGFNQITGRENYNRVEQDLKKLGIDAPITAQPQLLMNNITISALCTVMFYKQRIKADPSSPSFFEEALKATGGFSGSKEKKKVCYEYFLGQGVISDSTNKPAANAQRTYTKEEVAHLPQSKQMALLEDRSENATVGFKDPQAKYPLRNLLDEPDTNRLARGVIKETAIEFKDQTRTSGIPGPNDVPAWEQPLAPFGGEYPYSKVYETESGHLQVFDDTPGHETVSLYHRTGTFIDVDANGTQVNKIIGDGYTVIDRNGFIHIAGRCNITVGNSANIYVQGSCDLEVDGATNAIFHSQVDLGCAKDVNWSIGGDLNLKIDGAFNTTVEGAISTASNSSISTQAKSNVTFQTPELFALDAGKEVSFMSGESIKSAAKGEVTLKGDSGIRMLSGDKLGMTANGNVDIRSNSGTYKATGSSVHFRAIGGAVNMDGTAFRAQQGASQMASTNTAPDGNTVEQFDPLTLTAPEARGGAGDSFDILQTPVRPAPPVQVKTELSATYDIQYEDFQKNPGKYYDGDAAAAGVNPERPPQPNIGDAGKSMPPSGAEASDISKFLEKQLLLAKEGYWSERGMGGKPIAQHNQNIVGIWKDLGLESVMGSKGDQQAWCMAFVNWVLKQCNYRYVQSARAFDIRDNPAKWGATKVSKPEPGDIICWSYSHVSFVYNVTSDGRIIPCGGNQGGGRASDNNPSGGTVSVNYASGVSPSSPNIVGIYRPSKK